jgi:hypothetical protein
MPYVIAIIVLLLVGIGFTMLQAPKEVTDTVVRTEEQEITITPSQDDQTLTATTIPDGSHGTKVTYFTPKRDEYTMEISLTTENGIITDSTIVYSNGAEVDPNAQRFEGAYKEMVIGQSIHDLSLSRVAGASLTTNAFNEAVAKIVAENT